MSHSVRSRPEAGLFDEQVVDGIAAHGFFAPAKPIYVARAPGRLDVMGGNVDYTGGLVLQSLLRESTWAAVQRRADKTIRILNPGASRFGWEPYFELCVDDLSSPRDLHRLSEQSDSLRWSCYVLGALYFLKEHHNWGDSGGADLFLASDLPPNKGVSSSAALEIAVLRAASAAYGITLDGVALATAGQWTENVAVGAACGIMDQAAIVLGRKNHLLPLLCQPCQPFTPVTLPEGICIWGIDSMVSRSTTGAAYETARAAAFMGYSLICRKDNLDVVPDADSQIPRYTDRRWKGYLSNISPSVFRAEYERWLPERLSGDEFLEHAGPHVDPFTGISPGTEYPVRAAVRYAVEEHFRVQTVYALLRTISRDNFEDVIHLVGEIFRQSHIAYAECGLGSDACDELVSLALHAGFPGAKMTGGGAGGVVAVLGRCEDRPLLHSIALEYASRRQSVPYIFEGSSDGTDLSGVCTMHLPSLQS
ncbi:galactokinase [Paracidobacterium acidisoli]|uniref:Galactokinase n=1 Tax=Paracidobacterium acidisoli TaxID=2303751 RepID=A0A372ITE0_9BACT|nr:galactokinase family protein [Paracidobacterium acidisoli]MBT9330605.1 galactokinase [Paracidobacterium acidisoli]